MAENNNFDIKELVKNTIPYENFIELHLHLETSLLDGVSTPKEVAEKVPYGAAVTDHGVMYSVLKFQDEMSKVGKKPLFGEEFYTDSILDSKDIGRYHLILLAMNNAGLKNLYKLSSMSFKNIHTKPIAKWEWIKKHSNGLVCLTACLSGEVDEMSLISTDRTRDVLFAMKDVFGKERLFVEIQRHGIKAEEVALKSKVKLAKELGLDIVATNDSHFISKDFEKAHQAVLCIQTKSPISNPSIKFDGEGYYVHTKEEMLNRFKDYPEAVYNTTKVFNMCQAYIETGNYHVPKFKVPKEFKSELAYLEHLVWKGFEEKKRLYPSYRDEDHEARLKYEMSVVAQMDYAGYFLIVWDFIDYAHRNGIYVGPGRGSAAGSLMLNCLRITDIDPLEFDLLFERFLNPERVSMPDIDLDFEHERRQEVINYVIGKYGIECVSKIVTFGTLASKAVIKDVGKVYDYNFSTRNSVTKMMGDDDLKTLAKNDTFQQYIKLLGMEEVFEVSEKLEGRARHASQHACGVLIAPQDISDFMPTCQMTSKENKKLKELTTQLDMTEVERVGLLKFDFLGLRTLSCIKWALKFIKQIYGKEIKMNEIPLFDPHVYVNLKKSTLGTFQLESKGMFNLMSELFQDINEEYIKANPNKDWKFLFERIIAGVALYRPGPMDEIPTYIGNMVNGITYDHPMLENILKNTYGIFVYQEQITRACQVLAGFSGGQADYVRKGMGKKIEKIIQENKPYFIYGNEKLGIKGCINNGIPEETATLIWEKMEKFGKYAFNKSHAATYAMLSIYTAWLLYYYPECFIAGLLNSYIDKTKDTKEYLYKIKNTYGDIILPPTVNSKSYFTVEKDDSNKVRVRFGVMGVKGVGAALDRINIPKNATFEEYVKMALTVINASSLVKLAYIGFFNSFNITRKTAVFSVMKIAGIMASLSKLGVKNWLTLFDVSLTETHQEFKQEIILKREKELIGNYLSGHPTDGIKVDNVVRTIDLEDYEEEFVTLLVSVEEINDIKTKSGKEMKTLLAEDKYGEIKITCFDKFLRKYGDLVKDQVVVISGTVRISEFGIEVIAESASLPNVIDNTVQILKVDLNSYPVEKSRLIVEKLYSLTKILSNQNKVELIVNYCNREINVGYIPETYVSEVLSIVPTKVNYV